MTTDDPRIPMDDFDLARFMRKVEVDPSGCWLWKGWTNGKYGGFSFGSHKVYAHRVSYQHHVGPIPDGLTIDHLCKVKLCVNPQHLEVVAQQVGRDLGLGPQLAHAPLLLRQLGEPGFLPGQQRLPRHQP